MLPIFTYIAKYDAVVGKYTFSALDRPKLWQCCIFQVVNRNVPKCLWSEMSVSVCVCVPQEVRIYSVWVCIRYVCIYLGERYATEQNNKRASLNLITVN